MLYLMRHGQTVWNLEGRKQGQQDAPLTWQGVVQASALAKVLKPYLKDTTVYCSPLGRAKQYAALVLEKEYPFSKVRFDDRLMECDYGKWEGLTEKQIDKQFPGEKDRRKKGHWQHKGHGGESYDDIYYRAKEFLAEHDGEDMAIFCHEMISTVIRGNLFDWKQNRIMKTIHPQNVFYVIGSGKCDERKFCK